MYSKGKYIVGELHSGFGLGVLTAVVFNEVASHDTFKNMFDTIYGAGFFTLDPDGPGGQIDVFVHGESTSLQVKSRGAADVREIARALGLGE